MRFQGAIFDIDGVLVDSPHEQAWRDALAQLMAGPWAAIAASTRYTPEGYTSAVYQEYVSGKPREAGAQAALDYFGVPDPDGRRTEEYGAAKQRLLLALIERSAFAAYDDAIRLLLRLRAAGVRVAAASSSKNADLFLQKVPLARFRNAFPSLAPDATLLDVFDANVNGRAVPRGKPDPALFLLAGDALRAAPDACLVVEDAPSGVLAARAAGMACFALARHGDAAALRAAGADWVAADADAVPLAALLAG